jgi:hypothetical protein
MTVAEIRRKEICISTCTRSRNKQLASCGYRTVRLAHSLIRIFCCKKSGHFEARVKDDNCSRIARVVLTPLREKLYEINVQDLRFSRRYVWSFMSSGVWHRVLWLLFPSVSEGTTATVIRVEQFSTLKVEAVGGISSFRLARLLRHYHRNVLGKLARKVCVLHCRIILALSQLLIEPNCTRLKLIMCPDSHWCW